jgi:hypothetical protein
LRPSQTEINPKSASTGVEEDLTGNSIRTNVKAWSTLRMDGLFAASPYGEVADQHIRWYRDFVIARSNGESSILIPLLY